MWQRIKKLLLFWKKKQRNEIPLHSLEEHLDLKVLQSLKRHKIPKPGQLKYLPKLLNTGEKRKLAIAGCIFILSLGLLLVRVWYGQTVAFPRVGGSYTEGLVGSPNLINPLLAPGNDVDRDLSSLVFSSLLKTDADGNLVPDLAKTITVSDDQKIYTVELNDSLKWQDGEPLTVDDVVYTIKAIQDPNFKSPLRVSFSGVDVRTIDRNTISFVLQNPFPSFMSALAVGIIPEHLWYPIPAAQARLAELNIKPIGSGPYTFKSITKDTNGGVRSITLERNESFYGTKPYIKEMTFKFYSDYPTAIEALQNKNVDGLGFLPLENAQDLERNKNVELKHLSLSQYRALFFDPEKNDILKDKKVRKALAYAVDRATIVQDAVNGNGASIESPLIPGFTSDPTKSTQYAFDPDAAKKLLDDAGWKTTASSTIRLKEKKELAMTLTTVDQNEYRQAADIIKKNWEDIGVKTELVIIDRTKIKTDVIEPRNYQVLLFGQIIVSSQDVYAFWHSSQNHNPGNNLSVLANKDIDAALEALRTTQDPIKQNDLYQTSVTKLTDEEFAIFLYNPTYIYPVGANVHGLERLQRISIPSDRFASISQWYVKTSRHLK